MKKYVLTGISAIMMVGAAMITTSCDTENDLDVVNPNQAALDASWLEKFGGIDQNQDWSLATSAKAIVSVYGIDALSDYQLQLYTENPISSNNALLMASRKVVTDASGNASANFDVDIVKGKTVFYACYMDKNYRRNVKPVALINGIITAQFGEASTRTASANSDAIAPADVKYTDVYNTVMAKHSQAKEVDENNTDPNKANWTGSEYYTQVLKISAGTTWNGIIGVLAANNEQAPLARTLYVQGTWTLNGEQRLGGDGLIVVCEGGKIIIPENSHLNTDNFGRIVVLSGGSIEGPGQLSFHNGSKAGNEDYIAAGATVNVGKLNNNGGTVYNYGTLQANELMGGAGLSVYINRNQMIIDHSILGSSSANIRIYSCCCLTVEHDLCCRNLILYDPSYAHIKGNLKMSVSDDGTNDPTEILMAKNSHLTVDGGVALNNTSIVGPTDGWAICEFGKIGDPDNQVGTNYTTTWINGQEQITDGCVKNNLYISIDETEQITNYHNLSPYGKFVMKMMNGRLYDVEYTAENNYQGSPVYKDGVQAGNGQTVMVEKGKAPIYIPAGDCGVPEYQGLNGAPSTPQPQNFIIACEDLGSTLDVDFNDVVFSVGHVAGEKKITITPLAAGGTMEAKIYYAGNEIGEIHHMLGEGDTQKIINTTKDGITHGGASRDIPVDDENWTFENNFNKFSVRVTGVDAGSKFIQAPEAGRAPFMLALPSDWQWPIEYVNIETAYPGFVNWSQDANSVTWTLAPADGKTVNRQ